MMTQAQRTARRALTRRRVSRFLRALGVGLTIACGIGALGVLADRLFALDAPAWMLIAGPIVAACVIAAVIAAMHRPTLLEVASDVDRALGLKDRLGSGMALADRASGDPFAAIAVDESDRAASAVRVRDATPIALDSWWWGWPTLLAASVALALFLPVIDIAGRAAATAQQAARTEIAREAADDIADAREAIASATPTVADLPDADVRTLEELEEQLSSGELDPDRARAEAAGALGDAARRFEQEAQREEDRLDALRDRLARARSENVGDAGARSAIAEAIEQGDLDRASEELDRLADSLGSMDPAERAKRAKELRDLAEQAARAAERESPERTGERTAADDLRDLGMDERERESLREEKDRDAARDALREAGVDEAKAEELADRLEGERRRREAEGQAAEDARRLSEALREAAEEVAPEQPEAEPSEPTGDERSGDERKGESKGEETSDQKKQPREGETKPGETKPGETKPGETKQGETKPGDREPGRAEDRAPQPTDQPASQGERDKQQQGQPEPGKQEPGKQEPGQPEPGQPGQDRPEPGKPEQAPGEPGADPQRQPGQQPGDKPGEQPGVSSSQPQPGGPNEGETPGIGEPDAKGVERARRLIDEMRERSRQAGDNRERAEDARRRAEEMLDRLSPAERERLARWAEALSNERDGGPAKAPTDRGFAREAMGLRAPGADADRVIAEWANPEPGEAGAGVSRRPLEERLQEAAEGAERAIEEQRVHRRYNEIVRRYFERARRSSEKPVESPPG